MLDDGAPVIDVFAVIDPKLYFSPSDTIGFQLVAHDTAGGSGIQAARISWNGGMTWGAWTIVPETGVYVPARPTLIGAVNVRYHLDYYDYRQASTSGRIKGPGGPFEPR